MNKKEFIEKVAAEMQSSKNQAEKAINAVIDVIKEALQKGEEVKLVGFGSFRVIQTKPKKGRNLITGETIEIPSRKKVKFQPSKTWVLE